MKIYRIEWENPDKYLSYMCDFKNVDFRTFMKGEPLPDSWKFPTLEKEKHCKLIDVDFPFIFNCYQFLLMNENTWQIVNKPLIASGQYYSISINDKPHRICFPWHVVNCVNNNETDHNSYVFKTKLLGSTYLHPFDPTVLDCHFPLFQFERDIALFAIESAELRKEGLDFKYLVRKHKLTGLIFRKVWESD